MSLSFHLGLEVHDGEAEFFGDHDVWRWAVSVGGFYVDIVGQLAGELLSMPVVHDGVMCNVFLQICRKVEARWFW